MLTLWRPAVPSNRSEAVCDSLTGPAGIFLFHSDVYSTQRSKKLNWLKKNRYIKRRTGYISTDLYPFSTSAVRLPFFLNLCLFLQPFRLGSGCPRWRLACTCHATRAAAVARSRRAASAPRTAASPSTPSPTPTPRPAQHPEPLRYAAGPVTQLPARGRRHWRSRDGRIRITIDGAVRAAFRLMNVHDIKNHKAGADYRS